MFSFKQKSLSFNAVSNLANLFVGLCVGFFLTPFIIGEIGKENYGAFTLLLTVIGYFSLLTSSLDSVIRVYLSKLESKNKNHGEIFFTCLIINLIIGIIILGVGSLMSTGLGKLLDVPTFLQMDFKNAFLGFVFFAFINTFSTFTLSHLVSQERFDLFNISISLSTIVRALLIVILLNKDPSLSSLSYAYIGEALCKLLLGLLFLTFKVPVSISHFKLNPQLVKTIYTSSALAIPLMIADILRKGIDNIVIAKFLNVESVAIYAIAAAIIGYVASILNGVFSVLLPRFSRLEQNSESLETTNRIFYESTMLSSTLGFGALLSLALYGKTFLLLWVGEEFINSHQILFALLIGYSFAFAQSPAISLIYAKEKQHIFARMTLIEGILNLFLSLILVRKFGLMGVALGTTIPMLLIKIFAQPYILQKYLGIEITQYLKQITPSFISAVILMIVGYLIKESLTLGPRWYQQLLELCLISSVYLGFNMVFYFKINRRGKSA